MIVRRFISRPGYDCVRNPCGRGGCGSSPDRSHGIHPDDWIYVVSEPDSDVALSLTVFSNRFPASVPRESLEELRVGMEEIGRKFEALRARLGAPPIRNPGMYPMGASVDLHTTFPVSVRYRYKQPCELVRGGVCRSGAAYSSSLRASEIVRETLDAEGAGEQPEEFWRRLETTLVSWAYDAREARRELLHPTPPITSLGGVA